MHTPDNYPHVISPVGYPDTAAICGIEGCENAGRLFLKPEEFQAYQAGQVVVKLPTASIKVKQFHLIHKFQTETLPKIAFVILKRDPNSSLFCYLYISPQNIFYGTHKENT